MDVLFLLARHYFYNVVEKFTINLHRSIIATFMYYARKNIWKTSVESKNTLKKIE